MESLFSALPTPFIDDKIDYKSLEKLIDFQIEGEVEGLVFSGSTGEGHSFTKDEWVELIKFAVKYTNKRAKVVAGVGFNITKPAVEYAKLAEEIGVDYILATTPYYNKPQQDGIYQHFSAIANSAKNTQIILYNVPGRTATDMSNDTIVKLAKSFDNIIALKDATGKLERVVDLKLKLANDGVKNFTLLSGEDATQIGFNAMGGQGVISVVANIAPKLCKKIQDACKNNDYKTALEYQNDLAILSSAMFCESNPVPVKYALYKMGIFASDKPRLPLITLSEESKKKVEMALERLKK